MTSRSPAGSRQLGRTVIRRHVRLRAFDPERDAQKLRDWLRQPHVMRWWGDATQQLETLLQRSPETHAVILADGAPVGYLCWQRSARDELEAAGLADLPEDLVDIDIMIGEPGAVGRGIGPRALRLLLDRLRADSVVSHVGVGTSVANQRAVRAFEKAGFRLFRVFQDPKFGSCQYMVVGFRETA